MKLNKKTIIIVASLLAVALALTAWCIINNNDKLIFPILILFAIVSLNLILKKEIETQKKEDLVFNIDKNNSLKFRTLRLSASVFIVSMIFVIKEYFHSNSPFIIACFMFLALIVINYFISPKIFVADDKGFRYMFKTISWLQCESYKLGNKVLIIKTKKNHIVRIMLHDGDAIKLQKLEFLLNKNLPAPAPAGLKSVG